MISTIFFSSSMKSIVISKLCICLTVTELLAKQDTFFKKKISMKKGP